MHFALVYVYFFSSRSKVIKGVKRSNLIINTVIKNKTISNDKKCCVNVLGLDSYANKSMMTPSCDLPLTVKKAIQNFKTGITTCLFIGISCNGIKGGYHD